MATVRLTYPSRMDSENRMLDDVSRSLQEFSLPTDIRQAILLTVSEAFTNALTHGNRLDPSKTIAIELSINESTLVADITDQGTEGLKRVAQHQPPGPLSESGRGLSLIRHYASRVALAETAEGGLHVRIEFDLIETNTRPS
ncbi:hypothetical protein GF420_07155 [candidate division GN15 bacterium]|nr:hypothetical protein [candidate division GN15 bacterium]